MDANGLPQARERVTDKEVLRCKQAVIDHLSLAPCAGFKGSLFQEVQTIWLDLQVQWSGVFGDATRVVTKSLNTPVPNSDRGEFDLKRAMKWKFLPPQLLLRKSLPNTGTKATTLKLIIQRRLDYYNAGDWWGLIADYEADVIPAGHLHRVEGWTKEDVKEAKIWAAADLLSRFQSSKARKLLQSNGLGDHANPEIVAQMTRKHPKRKKPITGLTT